MITYVFFGIAIVFMIILFVVAMTVWLLKLQQHTRLVKTQQSQLEMEATTHLPYPLGATTCSHDWQEIKSIILENELEKKFIYIQQCPLCGLVDKTIESIKLHQPILPKSECRHRWKKQRDVELESAYEQVTVKGEYYEGKMSPWAFRKTCVITRICEECGEIDTVVASNYDLKDIPEEMWNN